MRQKAGIPRGGGRNSLDDDNQPRLAAREKGKASAVSQSTLSYKKYILGRSDGQVSSNTSPVVVPRSIVDSPTSQPQLSLPARLATPDGTSDDEDHGERAPIRARVKPPKSGQKSSSDPFRTSSSFIPLDEPGSGSEFEAPSGVDSDNRSEQHSPRPLRPRNVEPREQASNRKSGLGAGDSEDLHDFIESDPDSGLSSQSYHESSSLEDLSGSESDSGTIFTMNSLFYFYSEQYFCGKL